MIDWARMLATGPSLAFRDATAATNLLEGNLSTLTLATRPATNARRQLIGIQQPAADAAGLGTKTDFYGPRPSLMESTATNPKD